MTKGAFLLSKNRIKSLSDYCRFSNIIVTLPLDNYIFNFNPMDHNVQLAGLDAPAPNATIVDRIKYLIKLIRKNQAQFSELIGLNPSNISKVLSGKMPPGEALINRIVVNVGVSKQWLVNGTDVPFPRNGKSQIFDHQFTKVGQPGAPVYDIDVTAGSSNIERMFTEEHIIGRLSIPGVNPNLPLVKVTGDSMSPRLANGAYVSIRPVELDAPILWGQIYVILLEDHRMVKYIRHHNNPEKIILHSENPNYDDIEIDRKDIMGLFLVESILNYEIVC